jgi:hypothetical protein
MIRLFTIIISSTLFLGACKKEKKPFMLEISSTIKSQVQDVNIVDAKIVLFVQELNNNGVYSSAFLKKAEVKSDSNGKFSIVFEQGNAVNYRLEISKEQYFFVKKEFNSNDIRPDAPYKEDIMMMPEAFVKIRAINKNRFNENDAISISAFVENSDCDCCQNASYNFVGVADTSYSCLLYGPKEYKILYSVKRDNMNNVAPKMETFFCPALETKVFEIIY